MADDNKEMTIIQLQFEDGTTEDVEIPTKVYEEQILRYCKEDDITLEEFLERAVTYYSIELEFREVLTELEKLEQKYQTALEDIHTLIGKVCSVMADPDWREV